MPDAVTTTPTTDPASTPTPADVAAKTAPPAAAETTKTPHAEAISDELGDAGKAAIQKERAAREELARQLAESKALQQQLADQVQEFEDAKKSETEKLNDQLAALKKQIELKDTEITKAKHASMRAEVAAAKGVPANRLHGATREELEADAEAYLAEVAAHQATKRPPKPPVPTSGLKSGASSNGDTPTNPKARAAAALRQMRPGA